MTKETDINKWTRSMFEALPERPSWNEDVECYGIVILPSRRLHDSGYRMLDFIALGEKSTPICRLSGCSDVIHLDGISAMLSTRKTAWNIDCLKKSGLLRLWNGSKNRKLTAKAALSSFELTSHE